MTKCGERKMLRRSIIALAAVAAIGTALVSTEASAGGVGRHGFAGHGFGGFHSFGFQSFHRFHNGLRGGLFFGPGGPYDGFPYDPFYEDFSEDFNCSQVQRVRTPVGWRWQRIWVCG